MPKVFPPGVMNILTGGDGLGQWMVEHPDIVHITFTGSQVCEVFNEIQLFMINGCHPGVNASFVSSLSVTLSITTWVTELVQRDILQ